MSEVGGSKDPGFAAARKTGTAADSELTVFHRSPYIFPACTQQCPFSVRPRMTHSELVALNHAALTTMARGQWTPRLPTRNWSGNDIAGMRLHEDSTVLVDMLQLVPDSRHRPQLVAELTDSMLVRLLRPRYWVTDYCSAAAM